MTIQDIRNAKLEYFCQPIYDASDGIWNKGELLIRAYGPDGELYHTEKFIRAAEEYEIIDELDLCSLHHLCQMMPTYLTHGITQVGLNLSPVSCRVPQFMDSLVRTLERRPDICPYLVLEILETAEIEDFPWIKSSLQKLEQCGVHIAVDDFGKDNAGIARLLNLSFTYVKLDRGIVQKCRDNPLAHLLVHKIVEAMQMSNKKVVAEGVETQEQAEEMKAMGIRYLQGYYWSPPLPEWDFFDWCAQRRAETVCTGTTE